MIITKKKFPRVCVCVTVFWPRCRVCEDPPVYDPHCPGLSLASAHLYTECRHEPSSQITFSVKLACFNCTQMINYPLFLCLYSSLYTSLFLQ